MSDQLELTDQLVEGVKAALLQHDPSASDEFITIQYLAALTGYVMAHQDMPSAKREDVMQQLSQFAIHVMKQMEERAAPPAPAAPAPGDAFGIWKPKS